MSSDEPKKAGWYGWATFGYANTDLLHVTKCGICGSSFAHDKYPNTDATTITIFFLQFGQVYQSVGDSMNCPHCGAEGYGTYDEGGNYMLEWYEGENWS